MSLTLNDTEITELVRKLQEHIVRLDAPEHAKTPQDFVRQVKERRRAEDKYVLRVGALRVIFTRVDGGKAVGTYRQMSMSLDDGVLFEREDVGKVRGIFERASGKTMTLCDFFMADGKGRGKVIHAVWGL